VSYTNLYFVVSPLKVLQYILICNNCLF